MGAVAASTRVKVVSSYRWSINVRVLQLMLDARPVLQIFSAGRVFSMLWQVCTGYLAMNYVCRNGIWNLPAYIYVQFCFEPICDAQGNSVGQVTTCVARHFGLPVMIEICIMGMICDPWFSGQFLFFRLWFCCMWSGPDNTKGCIPAFLDHLLTVKCGLYYSEVWL